MANEVGWTLRAENDLADIWIIAEVRDEIALSAAQGEDAIRRDPQTIGESRERDRRVVFFGQLVIYWEWDRANQKATIFQIRFNPLGKT